MSKQYIYKSKKSYKLCLESNEWRSHVRLHIIKLINIKILKKIIVINYCNNDALDPTIIMIGINSNAAKMEYNYTTL